MDVDGGAVAVEADFEEPVGWGWPALLAVLSLRFSLFCCGDGLSYLGEVVVEPSLQGAESGQVGREILHVSSLHQNSNTRSTGGMGHYKVEHLTERQEAILRAIRTAIADTGEAPTLDEIGAVVGLGRSAVHYQLGELEAKNQIVRESRRVRGIRLT